MTSKKPWTVMVYLAADNNLASFGVDSLRQMKAAASEGINVVAEFDTGPMNKRIRYHFDGKARFGPIADDEQQVSPPADAGDPKNLEDFIVWTATEFPADHYFVIIWGHGAGVDDGISQAPDNSFVPRHRLLSLFKGILDVPLKGILDVPLKGLSPFASPRLLGVADQRALERGFDEIFSDIISLATKVIDKVLGELFNQSKRQAPGGADYKPSSSDDKLLLEIKAKVAAVLQENQSSLKNGPLAVLQNGVLIALQKGFIDALQFGGLDQLQREVIAIQRKCDHHSSENGTCEIPEHDFNQLREILRDGFLLTLQNSMLEAMQMGIFDPSQNGTSMGTKSLAFVDHPTTYMTNADLKLALRRATTKIRAKIDILGMDSCNMNMAEIGYELRDSVRLMVASQDDIPDASWPYDRILDQLAQNPSLKPSELASGTAERYVQAYADYGGQNVTLSVLDLEYCMEMADLVTKLAKALEAAGKDPKGQQAIDNARNSVRKFGQDQFVDLIHFCQLLTKGTSALATLADHTIGPLEFPIILSNQLSPGEQNCNGTSIYFPRTMPLKGSLEPLSVYAELDFAKITGWGDFLAQFLKNTTIKAPGPGAPATATPRTPAPTAPGSNGPGPGGPAVPYPEPVTVGANEDGNPSRIKPD